MTQGPIAWRNWHAWRNAGNEPTAGSTDVPEVERPARTPGVEVVPRMHESALYGDAPLVGNLAAGLGPYSLLNTIANAYRRGSTLGLSVVLRASFHLETGPSDDSGPPETDTSRFHGGTMDDEIASLLSLALGMRCQAGGPIRHWFPEADDPLGHPYQSDHAPPVLPPAARGQALIPQLRAEKSLDDAANLLGTYDQLAPGDAVALSRAARMYAQAVWVADADPNLAWLELVGAIEVAAVHRQTGGGRRTRSKGPSALERLEEAWPELAEALHEQDGEYAERVAKLLVGQVRSTRRFLAFMVDFAPVPPASRPPAGYQLDWAGMAEHLRVIYDYRSKALHSGTPFPPPMCEVPHVLDDGVSSEIPLGLGTWARDGSWAIEDTPMLLATFEHLARGALQEWWRQLPRSGT